MNELKWNWAYYPYLDAPNKQEESALKAGYIKVVIKDEADKVIAELKTNLSEIQSKKMQLEDDVALLRRNNAELKKEIESMKVKFREYNDNVCKKIVDASRTMSTISQDAQMDFYEEFIKETK